MKTFTRFSLVLPLLAALAAAPVLRAADPKPAAGIVTASAAPEPTRPLTISVDFPGGSVSRLLEAVAKTEGVSLSIVAGSETIDFTRIELPAFSLRNINLITLVQVMREFLQPRGYDFRPIGGGGDNAIVCVISHIEPSAHAPRTPPSRFMSFQLAPYLQKQSIDDIVDAIRTGWELDPAHDRNALKLKFHPGTSILLVSGPDDDALQLVRFLISNLQSSTPEPAKTPAPEKK